MQVVHHPSYCSFTALSIYVSEIVSESISSNALWISALLSYFLQLFLKIKKIRNISGSVLFYFSVLQVIMLVILKLSLSL